MRFGYSIQRHDFTAEEKKGVPVDEAIRIFETFDWDAELGKYDKENTEKNCPPNMGIGNGCNILEDRDAVLLQICVEDQSSVSLMFVFPRKAKLLGLFPVVKRTEVTVGSFPRNRVPELIQLLYRLSFEEIVRATK